MGSKAERAWPDLAFENEAWAAGYGLVAGVDEAGRGAWAGPVVAAAVILPRDPCALEPLLNHVDDSKRLTAAEREALYEAVTGCALAFGVGSASNIDIDRHGIVPATRLAMCQALAGLAIPPDYLLLDFLTLPEIALPQRGIPHGDALSLSIAAASILAKVTRDRWIAAQEQTYPGYGFARHKGYGTAGHQEALRRLGPCPLHRCSFRPLAHLAQPGPQDEC